MATRSVSWFCFVILLCSAAVEALKKGFTVELIHRDSPKSPYYDPSETHFQRVRNAVRRSNARAMGLGTNVGAEPSPDIIRIDGEYMIEILIGNPPLSILAIADTGSDTIWTQCLPCDRCYPQEAPLFDPKASSTYKEVQCGSAECQISMRSFCSREGPTCRYSIRYGDKSFSEGVVSTDMIGLSTIERTYVPFPGMVFGCGHNNDGQYFGVHTSGIVGLGPGNGSLVTQMGGDESTQFAYCLVRPFATVIYSSKLLFADDAIVEGSGVVITPLILTTEDLYYYVTLEGISVNGKKFTVPPSSGQGEELGNMIIDSGTLLTYLPSDLYRQIEAAVSAAIQLPRVRGGEVGRKLCYRSSGELKGAPSITVHFREANVVLNWYNAFYQFDNDITCFGFLPTNRHGIYGNLAQGDFKIGFDLTLLELSIQPYNCDY